MIDFACKQFEIEEIIKCALGLTKADVSVFEYFMDNSDEWLTTEKVASSLNLNLSTVQRAVKKLNDKGATKRIQNNLQNGGYIFLYQIKGRNHIKEIIMKIIKDWVVALEHQLEGW